MIQTSWANECWCTYIMLIVGFTHGPLCTLPAMGTTRVTRLWYLWHVFFFQVAAEEMLQQLIHWICFDDTGLGLPRLSGAPATRELGRPMMLLNVVSEFCGSDSNLRVKYMEQLLWSTQTILQHVCDLQIHRQLSLSVIVWFLSSSFVSLSLNIQHDGNWVHEHVLVDGGYPSGSQGRLSTPGHAIEAGWFLLQEANVRWVVLSSIVIPYM